MTTISGKSPNPDHAHRDYVHLGISHGAYLKNIDAYDPPFNEVQMGCVEGWNVNFKVIDGTIRGCCP